ncbi:MAG: hypothetical protein QXG00_05900 [Candidatus Woesearchaeota archaeon]
MTEIHRYLSVADILISHKTNNKNMDVFFHKEFTISDKNNRKCLDKINISFSSNNFFKLSEYKEIYDNSKYYLWRIFKSDDYKPYIIAFYKKPEEQLNRPYKMLLADNNFKNIYIVNKNGKSSIHPYSYIHTLIISSFLNLNKKGILLHSAMFVKDGKGFLFSGNSGEGKTTLSKLLINSNYGEIITDERVVIRKLNKNFYSYGTPWFGTKSLHKNKSAVINKIFFLSHSKENKIRRLSSLEAANKLMTRAFPTFWHKDGLEFALDFCSSIASEIECYEFGFVPDNSAVKYIMQFTF